MKEAQSSKLKAQNSEYMPSVALPFTPVALRFEFLTLHLS
jgi:hypothetical protein